MKKVCTTQLTAGMLSNNFSDTVKSFIAKDEGFNFINSAAYWKKYTAGIQCSCNALYAICFSMVKKVSVWKSYDLDYILEKGDKTFKLLGISRPLFMSELPHNIMIENNVIEVDMLENYFGLLGKDNIFENNASVRETGNGLIFMTGGFTISLIWSKKVFLFDSHSRDRNGTFTSNGNSMVLSFKSLIDVNYYIKMEYSKHFSNFREKQYELQYVRVKELKDNTSAISDAIKRNRKRVQNKASFDNIYGTPSHDKIKTRKCENHAKLFGTPEHDKVKKTKRAKYAELIGTPENDKLKKAKRLKYAELYGTPQHDEVKKNMRQRYSNIVGTEKHDKILVKQRGYYARKKAISSSDRILKFTTMIQEGPYYVCAVCNRCLYRRSVILFNIEKYAINILDFYHEVINSDGRIYICLTCHKKLLKSEIPAQAVWNKLNIYDFPADSANLNRLEKAIIARRILF